MDLIVNRIRMDMVRRGEMMSAQDVIDILAVNLIGVIPDDENVVVAANQGESLTGYHTPAGKAYENIEKSALDEVIFTDSIPLHQECSKIKVISVADMFAETIRNVVEHRSISDHFIM